MFVSQDNGIIVVAGEIIKSDYKEDKNGNRRAVYYLKTTGVKWTDPTGQEGALDVNWTISAWGSAASPADPRHHELMVEMYPDQQIEPEKYIAIEAIPKDGSAEIWRTKTNRPRETIKLHALFAQPIDQERLINTVKYHRQGERYPPWWRPDIYRDNDPSITGKYDDSGYDYGLGFQDDMRDDMEFFYEDERWSRD